MTMTELERLVAVETGLKNLTREMKEVKEGQVRMEGKLDSAITDKADKTEVSALSSQLDAKADAEDFKELRRLLISILVGVAGSLAVILIGIIVFLLKGHINF